MNQEELLKHSVKDYLIKKVEKDTGISEELIDKVVGFQFKDAHEATRQYNSIEFSGFGKFEVVDFKIRNRIRKSNLFLEKYKTTEEEKIKRRIEIVKRDLEFFENKLNRDGKNSTNIGRMEKPSYSS